MTERRFPDRVSEAKAAIHDYPRMRFIIDNSPDVVKELYAEMLAPSKAKLPELPAVQTSGSGCGKLSSLIDRLDKLQTRYSDAVLFMAWFEPAWLCLTDIERQVLSEFYMSGNLKSGATYRLMNDLGYCESNINRIRGKALYDLQVLLNSE